jgi:hypothetical protein
MPLLTELENLFLTGCYRDFAPTALCRRFSVAAGILPAVEPGRPARRKKRSHTPIGLKSFKTSFRCHHSFRAAGRSPSTADETSTATTHPQLFPDVTWNDHNETDH